jgi:hypothetical protein
VSSFSSSNSPVYPILIFKKKAGRKRMFTCPRRPLLRSPAKATFPLPSSTGITVVQVRLAVPEGLDVEVVGIFLYNDEM